jgi:hypothetical protein
LRVTTSSFFQLNSCGHSPYVTSSLTRGWVCHSQLLLALASPVTLRSESRGYHDHILLSQIRDSPKLEDQVPREQGGPVIPPDTGFTFRRLLRLAELRWRYSNPLPLGIQSESVACPPFITAGRASQETYYTSAAKTSQLMLLEKQRLYIVKTPRNTRIKCVGWKESFSVLKRVVHVEPLGLKVYLVSHGEFNTPAEISWLLIQWRYCLFGF